MTEREKELEEFEELKFMIKHKISNKNDIESLALWIQRVGYTKKHFPVEELKAWLRKLLKNYDKYDFIDNLTLEGKNPIQAVLDKIKELEDGT